MAFERNYRGTNPDGLAQTGDIIAETIGGTTLAFGDLSRTGVLKFRVIAFSKEDEYIICEALDPATQDTGILHTYSGPGPFVAEINACCRIFQLNNRSDSFYRLATTVTPAGQNRNPAVAFVPIVHVVESHTASFSIAVVDSDGDPVRWRLATDSEAGGGASPPKFTVDAQTGRMTWDNVGLNQTNFWTAQLIVEDLDASGEVKSQTPVDFFLKIEKSVGSPPSCAVNPPGPFTARPGASVAFTVTATDPDAGDRLAINTGGLPAGATITPVLPVSGPSGVSADFKWTPTAAQIGLHPLIFSVTDGSGQQSLCPVTVTVRSAADLAVRQSASSDPVTAGQSLTFSITVTNGGLEAAGGVTLTDTLPPGTRFGALAQPVGWTCSTPPVGGTGAVTCTTPTFGVGTAVFNLTLAVSCSLSDGATLSNTARADTANDPNPANNAAEVKVGVKSPLPQIKVTLADGRMAFDFGPIAALRAPMSDAPSGLFTIENPDCAALNLSLGVERVGNTAAAGDDSGVFVLRAVNGGSESPIARVEPLAGNQRREFLIRFNPLLPPLLSRVSGAAANQMLPEVINSRLTIAPVGGTPTVINLTGRVTPALRLIHPVDPRLAPLVTIVRSGDVFEVECFVFDPNLDAYLVRYEFLDAAGRTLGLQSDVDLTAALAASGIVKGQSFSVTQKFSGASRRAEIAAVRVTVFDREASDSAVSLGIGVTEMPAATVSAASYGAEVAADSMVSAFGTNLAVTTLGAAATPLPNDLGGTRVMVRDAAGIERPAPLFFVSPTQINYLIPPDTAAGAGTVTIKAGGTTSRGVVQVRSVAPALFSAAATGQGVAAAIALRVKPGNVQSFEPVAQLDAARQQFTYRPLDLGPADEQLYLMLFGTGLRHRDPQGTVTVKIGGIDAPVLYAGAQGQFVGLDQVNVGLPRALVGRGEVEIALTVDGRAANKVKVFISGGTEPTPEAVAATGLPGADAARRLLLPASSASTRAQPGASLPATMPRLKLPTLALPEASRDSARQRVP